MIKIQISEGNRYSISIHRESALQALTSYDQLFMGPLQSQEGERPLHISLQNLKPIRLKTDV